MRCPGRAGIPHGFERWESSSSEKLKTHVGNRGCCSEINGLIIAGGTLLSMKMIRSQKDARCGEARIGLHRRGSFIDHLLDPDLHPPFLVHSSRYVNARYIWRLAADQRQL